MFRPILLAASIAFSTAAFAADPVVVEMSFDSGFDKATVLADEGAPAWITKVEQQGGKFIDEPKGWQVLATQPEGVGRLTLTLDREKMKNNLVATILFDGDAKADIAVQLLDAENRVIILDLFGNIVEVGETAATNTFVIPLVKYPTAQKIAIRRISGQVNVHGLVLYPPRPSPCPRRSPQPGEPSRQRAATRRAGKQRRHRPRQTRSYRRKREKALPRRTRRSTRHGSTADSYAGPRRAVDL